MARTIVHPTWIEPMFFASTSGFQSGRIDPYSDSNHPDRSQVVLATRGTTPLYWIN